MEDDLCDDGECALPRQYEFRFHSTGVESINIIYTRLSGVEYYSLCLCSGLTVGQSPTNEFPIQDKYLKSSICTYSSVSNMKLIVVTSLGLLFK